MSGLLLPASQGFLLGASLIVAIGAQNAYVLRLGLMRRHVFAISTLCFLSDALLIGAGVGGLGSIIQGMPALLFWITLAGAGFLTVYGLIAFRRALRPAGLQASGGDVGSLGAVLATGAALTFLNPHVYLDTVVLLGSLSARFEGEGRLAYGLGAALASGVWFYGLGFGSRLLAPLFARPMAWRVLDSLIALVMWSIAFGLVLSL
ncbi:LysE/ArgO family amino acid transporter [Zavarzinia sp.]|uniref:LysE/ArgO family amino acid transporter n=1 Tax=Zavarzinia sp. TaxID=2027920 RepID=UPI003BB48E12|nr:LysE/ArgO family amino acid transporter [Zavarzinia sp.]